MARRLSFPLASTLVLVGWYLSSFLLVALVAAASLCLRSRQSSALTQAYYYAVMAAILYFVVSTLMLAAVHGACTGYHSREFKLNRDQRTLMLQTISFLIYLLGGAAVYSRIEGWHFLDAVYWADYTLLTIGIGNYAPKTHLGRSLLFPYATGAIIALGLLVSSLRSLVLQQGERKLAVRTIEKVRESTVTRMERGKVDSVPSNEPSSGGEPDDERNRQRSQQKTEFTLMRRIRNQAARRRRLIFVAIALGATIVLWFGGAIAFWRAEQQHPQNWSYFDALYFAYVSLMTIGYGALYPQTYFGRAFFVLWSLLAVPTLTILISSLEDTVGAGVRDLTLMIGRFTILPEDVSPVERLRRILRRASPLKETDIAEQGITIDEERRLHLHHLHPDAEGEVSSGRKEGQDHYSVRPCPKNVCHALVLSIEIQRIVKDLHASPPRKYSYEEWARFLGLMTVDSSSEEDDDEDERVRGSSTDEQRSSRNRPDNNDRDQPGFWLGDRSPLMSEEDEAEWIVARLCRALETLLREERERVTRMIAVAGAVASASR